MYIFQTLMIFSIQLQVLCKLFLNALLMNKKGNEKEYVKEKGYEMER